MEQSGAPSRYLYVISVKISLSKHLLLYNKLQQTPERCGVISLLAFHVSKLM